MANDCDDMPERIWLSPEGAHLPYQPTMHWEWQEYRRADLCASGQVRALEVDDLAQIIRVVDGNNTLGAGELAEAILEAMPAPQPSAATTTAQEAVPVGWITQPYPGVKWSFSFHEPNTLPEGWIARPLYAHPPQPSETVAEALLQRAVDLIKGDLTGSEWKRACNAFGKDALRALKGGA